MAEPFLAEIRLFPFDYAPQGWALCDGRMLPIAQNQALFSLIGANFGGDGQKTFALPDLRGRVPACPDSLNILFGKQKGSETVPLVAAQLPIHDHQVYGSSADATSITPVTQTGTPFIWAKSASNPFSPSTAPVTQMDSSAIMGTGGNQGHNNMQPYLTLNFCIALQGYYPPRP